MKKKILLFSTFCAFAAISLQSNTNGPASANNGNRTGSPGSRGNCSTSGCHSAPSGATDGSILVKRKSDGTAVTKYTPGETYRIEMTGSNTSLSHFGFQVRAQRDDNNGAAGTYSALPTGTKISTGNIVEHASALAKDGTGNYSIAFDWTAPNPGVGAVTVYGIINAVNNNGNSSGDDPSVPFNAKLADASSVGDVDYKIAISTYPNPAKDRISVKVVNATSGTYTVNAFDLNGRKMYEETFTANTANFEKAISADSWSAGLYHVQIIKDGLKYTTPVMKN